jgi:hypothetical protein
VARRHALQLRGHVRAILERKALKARIYPATDNGRPEGKPVLLTPAQWAEKKMIQGPATIACQMLQNPLAGQQAFFNRWTCALGGAAGDAERVHPLATRRGRGRRARRTRPTR